MPQPAHCGRAVGCECGDQATVGGMVAGNELRLVALDLHRLCRPGIAEELDPQAELVRPEERRRRRQWLESQEPPRRRHAVRRGARPVAWTAGYVPCNLHSRSKADEGALGLDADCNERHVAPNEGSVRE